MKNILTISEYYIIIVAMKMRVAYIKRPFKDKVYSYPFLITSYRDKNGIARNKTVMKLSNLPEHAVSALDVALRSEEDVQMVPKKAIRFYDAIPLGDTWAVFRLAENLGIIEAFSQFPPEHRIATMAMIIDRVINPKPHSKRALSDAYGGSSLARIMNSPSSPPLHEWYRSLETLYTHQMQIQKRLCPESTDKVFLYDITSSYFEGKCCPLAAFGHNRDGKKGKMQIIIGLLTTSSGRPIAIRVLEGNTADQSTVMNQIKELHDDFGVREMIFVGDRGMITHKRIEEIINGDYQWLDYITALKRSEMMSVVEDENHPVQLGLFDTQNLAEVIDGDRRYVLCHNPLRKDEDALTRNRLLDKTEAKLRSIADNVRDGRLKDKDKIAHRLYRWLNRWGMERFFKITYDYGYFNFQRDQDEIVRYSRLDGCYVIVTSVSKDRMEAEEVRSRYKELKQVEKAFRSMKTADLFVRPIRHWNPDRVRGHVFMCMLAYLIIWEAWRRLDGMLQRDPETRHCDGKSLREIWETLRKISIGYINISGQQIEQIGTINEYQSKILNKLGVPLDKKGRNRLSL
jgi:transposase